MKGIFKKITIGFVAFIATVACGFGIGFMQKDDSTTVVRAENAQIKDYELQEYYFSGESVTIASETEILLDGNTYQGTLSGIIAPNGDVSVKTDVMLSQVGGYSVCYDFSVEGKTYTAKEEFQVLEKNWSVGNANSVVQYGEIRTKENGTESSGLKLELAAGDTFTYNVPVNINEQPLTDLITMYSTAVRAKYEQTMTGVTNMEAGLVEVKLTDCYDPKIAVTCIIYIAENKGVGVYARTRATGQGEYGLYLDCPSKFGMPNVYIDGARYGVYNSNYGQSISGLSGGRYLKWSIEAESGTVYVAGGLNSGENSFLINQLYNPAIGGSVFPGFTTGEVYLSLTASELYTESTTFEIEAIGGHRGAALVSSGYVDDVAPNLYVDRGNADGTLYVKCGTPLKIFPATAYDPNLVGGVKTNVYYNYGTQMQSSVLVKDGSFIPTSVGDYTMEYYAVDSFGNVGRQLVQICARAEDVTTFTTENLTTLTAGVKVELPAYEVSSLNGDVTVDIRAISENGSMLTIDPVSRLFTPTSVGDYRIVYTYSDKLFQYTYEYTVVCAQNDGYGFLEEPDLQWYYIKDLTYSVPKLSAYEFTNGDPVSVPCEAYVEFDGSGTWTKIDDTATCVITGNETVRFKYVAEDTSYISSAIKIVNVDYYEQLKIQNYFLGDFTMDSTWSYIDFTTNATEGDQSLIFINRLVNELFSLEYSFPKEQANLGGYTVVLTDCADTNRRVELYFAERNEQLTVTLNGEATYPLNGRLTDGLERTLAYDAVNKAFTIGNGTETAKIPYEFVFTSNYCMMEIKLHALTFHTVLRIARIGNQLICKDSYDDYIPVIHVQNDVSRVELGAEARVEIPSVSDILTPVLTDNIRVSVTSPSGYVTSKDGVLLQDVLADRVYEIAFTEYGSYRISYVAIDLLGRESEQFYIINVLDMVAPTVTFTDGSTAETVQTVKVGYRYQLKAYTVSDNYCQEDALTVRTYLYDEFGVMVNINFDEFTLVEEGKYTVYVYCVDASGNYAYASYQLQVVAA